MESFEKLKNLKEEFTSLSVISDDDVNRIKIAYPFLPQEYLRFLREYGHGEAGALIIYSKPFQFHELLPGMSGESLDKILVFSDDTQGYFFGFDTSKSNQIVEVESSGKINSEGPSEFVDFILDWIGDEE